MDGRFTMKYPIHPMAALNPLLSEDELETMAAGIKADGKLQVPITLAEWTENGTKVKGIIDGQNRQEACEIAGVTPDYQFFDGDDDAIFLYIDRANNQRRNMTGSRIAMVRAFMIRERRKVGRPKKGNEEEISVLAKYSDNELKLLSQARQVLDYSEEIALGIKNGTGKGSLREHYDRILDRRRAERERKKREEEDAKQAAQEEQRKVKEERRQLNELRKVAPDLAKAVEDEEITLKQAQATQEQRVKDKQRFDYIDSQNSELADRIESGELSLDEAEEILEEERLRYIALDHMRDTAPEVADKLEKNEITLEEAKELVDEQPVQVDITRLMRFWKRDIVEAQEKAKQLFEEMKEHIDLVPEVNADVLRQDTFMMHQKWLEITNLFRKVTDQRRQFEVVKEK